MCTFWLGLNEEQIKALKKKNWTAVQERCMYTNKQQGYLTKIYSIWKYYYFALRDKHKINYEQ